MSSSFEAGCVPDSSPNVQNGFCVAIENMATQCAGIQASNSRGCPYGQMCCFRQANVAAREGESSGRLTEPVQVPEARADARVVPRSATAIKIPYNWPRFLR